MRTAQAYAHLLRLPRPVVTTREAAALFKVEKTLAVYLLGQMARDGLVFRVRRGLWAVADRIKPLALPEYLTAPFPSYVSLWTALSYHGMITQVPGAIHVISTGRPKRLTTALGAYQVHKIRSELFGGFETRVEGNIARPEKALFDTVYVSGSWRKRIVRLPELDIPPRFNRKNLLYWIGRIASPALRKVTARQLERVMLAAGVHFRTGPVRTAGGSRR